MRERPIRPDLENYKIQIESKFKKLLEETMRKTTDDWNMSQLDMVLKNLKKCQSRDAKGLANELFTHENIGSNLKKSLLVLVNQIKNSGKFPKFTRSTFIAAIPKKKKSPLELENERGIFLIHKIKGILLRLVYNSFIDTIEDHLSESNIGARRKKSPRDHLFVLNAVVNDVLHSKIKQQIDLVFYDVRQCYDSLWIERTLIDLYKNGLKNNFLNLIYEACKSADISVKNPCWEFSSRTNI